MNIGDDLNSKFILCFIASLAIFACSDLTNSKINAKSVYVDNKALAYQQLDLTRGNNNIHFSLAIGMFADEAAAESRLTELTQSKLAVNQVKILDSQNQTWVLLYSGRYKDHPAADQAKLELAELLQLETRIIKHPMSL